MHSSMIMDATGEYWTEGNIVRANNLMSFANITRLTKGRFTPVWGKRKETLQIFEVLMKQLNIMQDRKNELQRSAEDANFSRELFNPYMFAVENPEYKNQGAIIMAMLMDEMVLHPVTGELVPLLDKETGQFTIYDFIDGQIELKPEFRNTSNIENFEEFRGKDMQKLLHRMTDAVSRSQGNYDVRDIMQIKANLWGRAGTVFMTWFAEHVNQRFGMSGDKNYNLATKKKRRDGRFVEAYRSNKVNTSIAAALGLTVAYGIGPVVLGVAGVGTLGLIVYNKFIRKTVANPDTFKREVHTGLELVHFLRSILVESLNYPGRFFQQKDLIKNTAFESLQGEKTAEAGKNMSMDEIAAMRAITRELAIVLSWLAAKLAMGMLMYDDDDDKESPQRMKYNWIQNQMSRAINTLIMYANPQELVTDQSRMAAVDVVSSVGKLLLAIVSEKQQEDFWENAIDAAPIPRILTKGRMPYHDKKNYDELVDFDKIPAPMAWTAEFYKNNAIGPEREAEKKYRKLRGEIRDEIRASISKKYGGKKSLMKKEEDELVDKKVGGPKKPGQTYTEKLKEMHSKGIR